MPVANGRRFIADYQPNERFQGVFSIGNPQLAMTKNGDPYLACLLGDRTGQVPGRRWQMPPEDVYAVTKSADSPRPTTTRGSLLDA